MGINGVLSQFKKLSEQLNIVHAVHIIKIYSKHLLADKLSIDLYTCTFKKTGNTHCTSTIKTAKILSKTGKIFLQKYKV